MVLEEICWSKKFSKWNDNNNDENWDIKEWIAIAITEEINKWLTAQIKELSNKIKKQDEIVKRIQILMNKEQKTRKDIEEFLSITEELYEILKDSEEIKNEKLLKIFKQYLIRNKDFWRTKNKTREEINRLINW